MSRWFVLFFICTLVACNAGPRICQENSSFNEEIDRCVSDAQVDEAPLCEGGCGFGHVCDEQTLSCVRPPLGWMQCAQDELCAGFYHSDGTPAHRAGEEVPLEFGIHVDHPGAELTSVMFYLYRLRGSDIAEVSVAGVDTTVSFDREGNNMTIEFARRQMVPHDGSDASVGLWMPIVVTLASEARPHPTHDGSNPEAKIMPQSVVIDGAELGMYGDAYRFFLTR